MLHYCAWTNQEQDNRVAVQEAVQAIARPEDEPVSAPAALANEADLAYARFMKQPLIASSPQVMGGTPVFANTRVPVQTLFDYLEAGDSIDEFLEGFPSVSREQVLAFLEEAKIRMLAETR